MIQRLTAASACVADPQCDAAVRAPGWVCLECMLQILVQPLLLTPCMHARCKASRKERLIQIQKHVCAVFTNNAQSVSWCKLVTSLSSELRLAPPCLFSAGPLGSYRGPSRCHRVKPVQVRTAVPWPGSLQVREDSQPKPGGLHETNETKLYMCLLSVCCMPQKCSNHQNMQRTKPGCNQVFMMISSCCSSEYVYFFGLKFWDFL